MATILVVDDEQMFCDLMRAALSRRGHVVLTATGGREALDLFRQHRPSITMLDLCMPEMDGIAVLKQIRAVDSQASVIVLTAAASDSLENQARKLGVTEFLRKGLSLPVLEGILERVMQQPARAPTLPPLSIGASGGTQKTVSILVVDDKPSIRDLLANFLAHRGYQVHTAQNGKEALALAERIQPRVIILDLYMPGMNGVAVVRELNAMQYSGSIIMLTASEDEKLLREAWDLGSMDLLGKPVDLDRLLMAVEVGQTRFL